MKIMYIGSKAYEYVEIELPKNENIQKNIRTFLDSHAQEIKVLKEHENGMVKVISAYVPCSYIDNLKDVLI